MSQIFLFSDIKNPLKVFILAFLDLTSTFMGFIGLVFISSSLYEAFRYISFFLY